LHEERDAENGRTLAQIAGREEQTKQMYKEGGKRIQGKVG
jgi:hypothetical protein